LSVASRHDVGEAVPIRVWGTQIRSAPSQTTSITRSAGKTEFAHPTPKAAVFTFVFYPQFVPHEYAVLPDMRDA
jgi:hypothetical protein